MESEAVESIGLEVGNVEEFRPEISVVMGDAESSDPPEYYMLDVPAKPVSDPGMPPLDYDTVMAEPVSTSPNNIDELEKIKDSLMADAPPTYREVFGTKQSTNQTNQLRRVQRPHNISRRHQATGSNSSSDNALCRLFSCMPSRIGSKILVITISLMILILPLSMVIVGSLNVNVCSTKDIPLYLIIAGCCLSLEVFIHTSTILASMNTDNESTLRSLRMCDCFAFFILIWILIGSNWIFKVSVNSKPCSQQDPGNELFNEVDNSTALLPAATTPGTCEDCSDSVYQFAIGLIVVQYIVVFSVFVICCCAAIRKGSH